MQRRPELIVMAKAPGVGRGKQRLAKQMGAAQAWRVNRLMHRRTLQVCQAGPWRVTLCVTPDSAVRLSLPGVWPTTLRRQPQGQGDLGARIARAVAQAKGPLCVIGTDCPAMTVADLKAAFKALNRRPAVLGPAQDGGFWLVGVRKPTALIKALPGVRWSTPHAAEDILKGLPGPVARLRHLADIDDLAAWRAYLSKAT